ncbi:MAG: OsmC family protein [Acidimicrobiales bacterium]
MNLQPGPIASAIVSEASPPYRVDINTDGHVLIGDEPEHNGGADAGPSPFGLVLSGLGSCTAMTLRMYAERKGWPLTGVRVEVTYEGGEGHQVSRIVTLEGDLDDEQVARLAEIADRTPVARALAEGMAMRTAIS